VIHQAYSYPIFRLKINLLKIYFFKFLNILKDHFSNSQDFLYYLKNILWTVEIQTSISKIPFFTLNYLADNYSENFVYLSESKFVQVVLS